MPIGQSYPPKGRPQSIDASERSAFASEFAKIVVLFDRPYQPSRDSSVKVYIIKQDVVRTQIISYSISIGERDMGAGDVMILQLQHGVDRGCIRIQ